MECSESELQPPLKNQKTESQVLNVEDRISHLPDAVICHILSFTPTKYSIRTSVLSKRWEHLWALSPKFNLVLKLWCHNKKEYDRLARLCSTFTHSVDNLLFLRNYLRIEKFKLHFNGPVFPPPMRISSWICDIVMSNVCELDLAIGWHKGSDLGELPLCLFTCKTLEILKLSGLFILNGPHSVCLPNLKTLYLDSIVYLGDALFPELLLGCPRLEDLEFIIHYWDPMWIHNVDLSSLKRFSLYLDRDDGRVCRRDDDQYKFVVDAPNLEFIELRTWSDDVLLKNLPNIVEAHLDIDTVGGDEVFTVLQSIVNVKRLFLSECTLVSLGEWNELALPTFCNLVQLELCYISGDGPVRLMDLLRSSPKLEVLSMPTGIYHNDYDRDPEYDHNPEQVPECLHSSLKSIQIEDFFGEEKELGIVEYLLENSMVLEKMTIFCYPEPTSEEFVELKAKLTNYSRLSTECQLDLLYQCDPLYDGKKADFCFSTRKL